MKIPPLNYLDRYRNAGTRTYSPHAQYTEARPRYRPASDEPTYRVPAFLVPLEELNLYSAHPDPVLGAKYVTDEGIRFCVHPQVLETLEGDPYLERIKGKALPLDPLEVVPTSSTRTVIVQEATSPHALKLHFPFRISRYGRRMRDEVVEQAVAVSREVEAGLPILDPYFAFFREVLGITFRNLELGTPRGENWGFLVREMTPFPTVHGERSLVPGFSLYGRDHFDPDRSPLLHDFLERGDPKSFVLEEIMLPIIRHWVGCFLNLGLLLEPHGQNVLLEIGEDHEVLRIVHRDLNLGVDNRRRRDLGIVPETGNTYNQMEGGEFSSITYDKFMGGHFFEPLVTCVRALDCSLTLADFQEPCKEEFRALFPDHVRYLPRTVHYFSETRDRFGKPLFLDTGIKPAWRP
jgi:hypothetical protein